MSAELRISINIPSVARVMGNVKKERIGLLKVLITANHIDTTNAAMNPLTSTPGSKYAVMTTAILLMSKFTNRFCMEFEIR